MKTKHSRMPALLVLGILCSGSMQAQVSTAANNSIFSATDFVGWDNSVINDPLQIRHNANQPIEWYTDAIRRMWLTPTLTGQTMNGYPGLNLSGHLGIGRFSAPVTTPLAMLHLDSAGSQVTGYRPWMGTGTLMTKRSDMMYVGMLGLSDDRNDAIIGWSDNAGSNPTQGPDRLRFIFTQRVFDPPNHIGQTYYGLEIARMVPDAVGDEGFLGVGDWATAGLEPVERLDILDGRVRIRELPDELEMDSVDKYVVVNEDGVLGWRNIPDPGPGGGADCDWDKFSAGNHLRTAWNGAASECPDEDSRVGIGVGTVPGAKLHVYRDFVSGGSGSENIAGLFDMAGSANVKLGLRSFARGAGTTHIGIQGRGLNASSINTGVQTTAGSLEEDPARMTSVACCRNLKFSSPGTNTILQTSTVRLKSCADVWEA